MANILLSKLKAQQHSCINCNELFIPDARNRRHQQYCSNLACRKASKRASQQRYLSSEKGKDSFRGAYHVNRVREWRKAHPGYWKRKKAVSAEEAVALQDFLPVEVIENKAAPEISENHALQDICFLQPALIVGLIANLTGSALQEDIVSASRRLVDFGRDILGKGMPLPNIS